MTAPRGETSKNHAKEGRLWRNQRRAAFCFWYGAPGISKVIDMPAHKILTKPRVDTLVDENEGSPNELLSVAETASWLGVSSAYLDIGRAKGYGPPFKHLGARNIRYQRSDVVAWLKSRTFTKMPDGLGRSRTRVATAE